MATRDRPELLSIALRCFREQSWPRRELIVVDDGEEAPADPDAVEEVGGRLLRVPSGTPLGEKLNLAAGIATGEILCKWDDDDWYSESYLGTMAHAVWTKRDKLRCVVAFVQPFTFLWLRRWQLRRSDSDRCSGATLCLPRCLWQRCPFRPLRREVDAWLLLDALALGVPTCPVDGPDLFLQVRHRGHLWTQMPDHTPVEVYLEGCVVDPRPPEEILPPWAVDVYRRVPLD
jgi:hypothetical protein